jgi:hypothetical protein
MKHFNCKLGFLTHTSQMLVILLAFAELTILNALLLFYR